MTRRCAALALGIVLGFAGLAQAEDEPQRQGAGQALLDILIGQGGEGALTLDTVAALSVILSSEAATFPLASSSGGFTWTFDPTLGVQTRRTQSFGPTFAERPFTNGRKKLNIGVAFQHTGYNSLGGESLSNLRTVYSSQSDNGSQVVETFASNLSFTTDRTIISASYGLTDRVDIGFLVPIESTKASGSSAYTVNVNGRVIPPGQSVLLRYFGEPIELGSSEVSNIEGRSSGIGDVIVRGKAALVSMQRFDLGAGIDLRLPTGDDEQLLGLGKAQTRLMVMGASTIGKVAPHFNFGYTFSGKGIPFDEDGSVALFTPQGDFNIDAFQPSDEVNYTFGVDIAATPSVTVMGDIIGRSLRNSATFEFNNFVSDQYFDVLPGTLNLLLGTIGTKIKIGNEFLFTASVVFPLNSAGVKPGVTPVIGFERAF